MLRIVALITAVMVFSVGTAAFAEPYQGWQGASTHQKLDQMAKRINDGVADGSLTRHEAERLRRELNDVRAKMADVDRDVNRLSAEIFRERHDDQYRGGGVHQARWERCASESGYCNFRGNREVRYGVEGRWVYRNATNGIPCNNQTFGDPAPGVGKACFVKVN